VISLIFSFDDNETKKERGGGKKKRKGKRVVCDCVVDF